MFASIKAWVNVPFQYKPFMTRTGAGTKQFGATIAAMCYPVGDVKLVTNAAGAEVTSTTQLYLPGTCQIKVTDNVIFDGAERPILRINDYYHNGVKDIRVVYL